MAGQGGSRDITPIAVSDDNEMLRINAPGSGAFGPRELAEQRLAIFNPAGERKRSARTWSRDNET